MITTTLGYFLSHLDEYNLDDKMSIWITPDDGEDIPIVNLDYEDEMETLMDHYDDIVAAINEKVNMNDYAVKHWTIMGEGINVVITKVYK